MRIAVVDDEKKIIGQLQEFLYRFAAEQKLQIEVCPFLSAQKMLEEYDFSYDIIFMDIEMEGMDGLAAARKLRELDERVVLVFVTNMAQYAIRGYEVDAVDFVVKPVSYANFAFRLQKALRHVPKEKNAQIAVRTADGLRKFNVGDIYFVEVILHYLIYHTVSGDYKVRGTIREAQEQLEGHAFVRSNNCYLVNLQHVEAVNGHNLTVNGTQLQISRNRKNDFMQAFTRYMGGIG